LSASGLQRKFRSDLGLLRRLDFEILAISILRVCSRGCMSARASPRRARTTIHEQHAGFKSCGKSSIPARAHAWSHQHPQPQRLAAPRLPALRAWQVGRTVPPEACNARLTDCGAVAACPQPQPPRARSACSKERQEITRGGNGGSRQCVTSASSRPNAMSASAESSRSTRCRHSYCRSQTTKAHTL
jgi:hypothetical protein